MSPGRLGAKVICPGPPCAVKVLTKNDSPPGKLRMAVWQAADGLPYAPYLVAGLAVNLVAVGLLVRRFERIAHR